MSVFRWTIGVLILTSLLACRKEELALMWDQQLSNTDELLTSVFFLDPQHGFAVGGKTWTLGVSLSTADGGITWQADSLTNKLLYGLYFDEGQRGYCSGIDGYLFRKDEPSGNWNFFRFPEWQQMRDLSFREDGRGVMVGGQAYANGVIVSIGPGMDLDTIHVYEHELNGVCFSDEQTVHAVGYGLVLRSDDAGLTWTPNPIDGDFFRSVHFPSASVGYAVGFNCTIIKTTDGGHRWERLRKGGGVFSAGEPFRSVFFVDEFRGYIVGDHGVFWKTIDGGDKWQVAGNLPEADLYDVHVVGQEGWIVGEGGLIIRFFDP